MKKKIIKNQLINEIYIDDNINTMIVDLEAVKIKFEKEGWSNIEVHCDEFCFYGD